MTRTYRQSVWFLDIFLDTGTRRWTNGFGDLDLGGQTYTGLGERWSPPESVNREASLTAQTLKLNFDSSRQTDNSDAIGALLDQKLRRRRVRLRQILIADSQTPDQGTVIVDERGRIRDWSDSLAAGSAPVIELEIESGSLVYLERRMQTRSHENQRIAFPGDDGFLNTLSQQTSALYWGGSYVSRTLVSPTFGERNDEASEKADRSDPPAREMVLGRFATEGTFIETNAYGETNRGNAILQRIVALADHQINRLDKIWFDGELVHDAAIHGNISHGARREIGNLTVAGKYGAWITFYDGRHNQATSSPEFPEDPWDDARVLKGVAYAVVEIWDSDYSAELPNVRFGGEGARLYDRRRDTTAGGAGPHRADDPDTWTYSTNPMVAIDHYRIGRVVKPSSEIMWFGVGEDADLLPYAEFEELADYCEDTVALKAGGTQLRYEANGFLTAEDSHKDNLELIASAMAAQVIDQGGRIAVRPARARPTVLTITDDDLLKDEPTVARPGGRIDELANTIEGRFNDEAADYERNDYPRVSSATYIDEDGDEITVTHDLDLEVNGERAQRLASLELARRRRIFTLEDAITIEKAAGLEPGDWYVRESALRGFSDGKTFEVDTIKRTIEGVAHITGYEVDPDDLAWDENTAVDLSYPPTPPPVILPYIFVPDTTLAAVELSANGALTPGVRIDFAAMTEFETTLADTFEIEYYPTGDTASKGRQFMPSDETSITLAGFLPSTQYAFRFRGRAGSRLGDWTVVQTVTTTANATSTSAAVTVWSDITGAGKPADNADVTGQNEAASITDQSELATSELTETDVDNTLVPTGQNMLRDGSFRKSFSNQNNWVIAQSGGSASISAIERGDGFRFALVSFSNTPVWSGIVSGLFGDNKIYCKSGDRIGINALVAGIGLDNIRASIIWYDADENYITETTQTYTGSLPTGTGSADTFIELGHVASAPANTAFARARWIGFASGATGSVRVALPTAAHLSDDQNVPPQPTLSNDYADAGADPTIDNEAASFTGQGELATANAYYQETEPTNAPVKSTWYKPSTKQYFLRLDDGSWGLIANVASGFSVSTNKDQVTYVGDDAVQRTDSVTVTPSGGTTPYTGVWTKVTGDTVTVDNPTSPTTTFSSTSADQSGEEAIYRYTVTDADGNKASIDVGVQILFFTGGGAGNG